MKKLFLASVFALATLTACNNETSTTTPEEQQNQTFSSQTMTRDGNEDEEAAEAELIVQEDMKAGGTGNVRILCHTNYSSPRGNACVKVNNHLFNVTWYIDPYQTDPDEGGHWSQWTSTLVSSCNCR